MFLQSIAKQPTRPAIGKYEKGLWEHPDQKVPPPRSACHTLMLHLLHLCAVASGANQLEPRRGKPLWWSPVRLNHFHTSVSHKHWVFPPRAKWNVCLNTLLLQLMTSLSLQVNHSLQKPFLEHPLVKRSHFKDSLSSREWSDRKKNGFKLTRFTEEEVQQYGDLRAALPLCFTGCILEILRLTKTGHTFPLNRSDLSTAVAPVSHWATETFFFPYDWDGANVLTHLRASN